MPAHSPDHSPDRSPDREAVIFVVDDDSSVREALSRLLAAVGYRVETYECAHDFLLYGHRDVHGCLILDVRMPGLSGLLLQQKLRAFECAMPVVFVTAHDDDPEPAMAAGAVAFLRKPFDDQVLLAAVRRALDADPS